MEPSYYFALIQELEDEVKKMNENYTLIRMNDEHVQIVVNSINTHNELREFRKHMEMLQKKYLKEVEFLAITKDVNATLESGESYWFNSSDLKYTFFAKFQLIKGN